ncbi:MAG: hypothetical protein HYX78_12205 [Armatimonadetes bacterium]|nr:hypothetical protein [Armatimonadota bacterium]
MLTFDSTDLKSGPITGETSPAKAESGLLKICGPKAASLGRLARLGFVVPNGFCLSADAYRSHLWSSGVRSLARDRPDAISREALRRAIRENDLPYDVESAIKSAYSLLGDDIPVVVRHSALDNCAAGVYTSVAGVKGAAELIEAVKTVWASLWSDEAAEVREKTRSKKEPAMAVIVQALVDANATGTATTANIATGNPNELVIRCPWSVYSGEDPADIITVDLKDFRITSSNAARRDESEIIDQQEHPTDLRCLEREAVPLSDWQITELAEAAVWVDKCFGGPQTVHWAYDGEKFVILSAMPIRPMPPYFPVSLHSGEEGCVWHLVSPEPVSALAQSLLGRSKAPPRLPSDDALTRITCQNGRAYRCAFEQTQKPGLLVILRDIAAGWRLHRRWKSVAGVIVYESRKSLSRPVSKVPLSNLKSAVCTSIRLAGVSSGWFEAAPRISRRFCGLVHDMLPSTEAGPCIFSRLLMSGGPAGLDTDRAIQHLSAYAWQVRTGEVDNEALKSFAAALARKTGYAFQCCLDAVDPAAWQSWPEDQSPIIQLAESLARGPVNDIEAADMKAAAASRSAESVALAAPKKRRRGIGRAALRRILLNLARDWLCADGERSRVHALALSALRSNLLDLGRRLTDNDLLNAPEEIFHLTAEQIIGLRLPADAAEKKRITHIVAQRKHETWLQSRLVPPPVLPVTPAHHDVPVPRARMISGAPASPGQVIGKARIAASFCEAAAIEPGEILVVDKLAPAWTPLLGLASGLVMSNADMFSTGAVAARYYGIPCVIGITNATSVVRSGYTIRIDGSEGMVEISRRKSSADASCK